LNRTLEGHNNKSRARHGIATGEPDGLGAARRVADVTEAGGVVAAAQRVSRESAVGGGGGRSTSGRCGLYCGVAMSQSERTARSCGQGGHEAPMERHRRRLRPERGQEGVEARWRLRPGRRGRDANFAVTILEGSWHHGLASSGSFSGRP
jgi:hypothetical protein